MRRSYRFFLAALPLLLSLSVGIASCNGKNIALEEGHHYDLASLAEMPAEVRQAPVTVQQAYQFAVANPEVLKQIPCYCGCGVMGHNSNYACYVADTSSDGEVIYDNHALGCSICVDISQDTMRLLDQGKELPEIFAYVDSTYARFGPPTPLEQ